MRLYFVIILFLSTTTLSFGQSYSWEVGGSIGGSNYFGDIGGVEFDGQFGPADIMLNSTSISVGGFARRMLDYRYYVNFQLNYVSITGDDLDSPNTGRSDRNLRFENQMVDVLVMAEYHPLIINDFGGHKRYVADFHWYVSTGLGVLYHNPTDNGQYLQPLNTEGPQNKYSLIQAVIPLSTGAFITFKGRYSHYRVHRIGINLNYRLTFTDYLDDVSSVYPEKSSFNGDQAAINASYQGAYRPDDPDFYPEGKIRGNPNKNDGYLTTMISYSKLLRSKKINRRLPRREMFYGKSKKRRKLK